MNTDEKFKSGGKCGAVSCYLAKIILSYGA